MSYCFIVMFTLPILQSSHNTSFEGSHAEFLLYGRAEIFLLNLEWNCTFVHCPEMVVQSKSMYCVMYLSNPHQAFYSGRGADLGMKPSENPFPSAIQQTGGHSNTACSKAVSVQHFSDFASSPVTLLWAAAPVGWNCSGARLVSACLALLLPCILGQVVLSKLEKKNLLR